MGNSSKNKYIKWIITAVIMTVIFSIGIFIKNSIGNSKAASKIVKKFSVTVDKEITNGTVVMTENDKTEKEYTETLSDKTASFENVLDSNQTYLLTVYDENNKEVYNQKSVKVTEDGSVDIEIKEKATVTGKVLEKTERDSKKCTDATIVAESDNKKTVKANINDNGEFKLEVYEGETYDFVVTSGDLAYEEYKFKQEITGDTVLGNIELEQKKFDITINCANGGNISELDGKSTETKTVVYGENVSYNVEAKSGYEISSIKIGDKTTDEFTNPEKYTIDIEDIKEDCVIDVAFVLKPYAIEFKSSDAGTTKDIENGKVKINDNSTITIMPNEGYEISKVVSNGKDITKDVKSEKNGTYKTPLGENSSEYVVEVILKLKEYDITIKNDGDGKVTYVDSDNTLEEDIRAEYKGSYSMRLLPDNGNYVSSVKIKLGDKKIDLNSDNCKLNEDNNYVYEDKCEIIDNNDNSYTLKLTNIKEDIKVTTKYEKIDKNKEKTNVNVATNGSVSLDNKYFTIKFAKEVDKYTNQDGATCYVLDNDEEITVTPKSNYEVKASNGSKYSADEFTLKETICLSKILVREKNKIFGKVSSIKPENEIKVINDSIAPKIEKVTNGSGWFWDKIEMNVEVSDEGGADIAEVRYSDSADSAEEDTYKSKADGVEKVDKGKDENTYKFTVKKFAEYNIWCYDTAGNKSEIFTNVAKFDNNPPTVSEQKAYVAGTTYDDDNFLTAKDWTNQAIVIRCNALDEENDTSGRSGIREVKCSSKEDYYNDNEALVKNNSVGNDIYEFDIRNYKNFSGKYYIWAVDNAGNKSKAVEVNVNYDNTKPVVGEIKTDANGKDNWSQKPLTITVSPKKDENSKVDSGIKELIYYNLDENGKRYDEGKTATKVDNNTFQFETETEDGEPVKTGKMLYGVYFVDNAGNRSDEKQITVGIDTKEPVVNKFSIEKENYSTFDKVINFLSFGTFFNEKIKVKVYAEDISETGNDNTNCSGVKEIVLYGYDDNNKAKEVGRKNVEDGKAVFTLEPDFNKKIKAVAIDNVNLESEGVAPTLANSDGTVKNSKLILENTKPTGKISCEKATYVDSKDREWYANEVDFTVNVGDEQDENGFNSGLNKVDIKINNKSLEKDINNKDISHDYSKDDKITMSDEFVVSTNQADREKDGSYLVNADVKDNACNKSKDISKKVYIDNTKPIIEKFAFHGKGNQEADGSIVSTTNYGYFFSEDVTVEVQASDNEISAGLKSITYYTINFANDSSGIKSEEVTKNVDDKGKIKFTVSSGFKGQIYARATDNVNNVGDKFVRPDGVIVEDASKHSTTNDIKFDLPKTEYSAENGIDLYASDVSVDVTVSDTFSGIKSVEWNVDAPSDKGNNQSGKLDIDIDGSMTGNQDGWSKDATDKNLVTEVSKKIVISNNSNDIRMTVKLTDRAGNTSTEDIIISIDKTNPVVSVSYDNNNADEGFINEAEYYKANRTATVTIKERNFDADRVKTKIENAHGYIPRISNWSKSVDNSNPDANTYTATILYDRDGDYTFDIDVTDRANNASNDMEADKFTIDKTIPTVSVAYDNNDVKNEKYYKANRTATITINEHNFETTRFSVSGTASCDGKTVEYPSIGKWTNEGDIHKTTITFSADGDYTFDLDYADKAGNEIEDFTEQEFCIDKTAPTVKFEGVEDKSANNGKVEPIVTYEDLNFDEEQVLIELKGYSPIHVDGVELRGTSEKANNGGKFTFENFEEIKENDDLYELKATIMDKAGNEAEELLEFSVNRFGSVYSFASNINTYRGKFIRDEVDVIVKETNVDKLEEDSIEVKVTKNGTSSKLVKDKDFTLKDISGDGKWSQYEYKIKADVFKEDAKYIVSIFSKDVAGNKNDSTDETKEAELWFGIDKTNPIVISNNVSNDETYPVDKLNAKISATDNLVLNDVKIYCNGKEVEYEKENEECVFSIESSTKPQNMSITAVDAAGNKCKKNVKEFYVTTNLFIRWRNNTVLFVSSIVAFAGLIGFAFYKMVLNKNK